MLRIKIEIVPLGKEEQTSQIDEIHIINNGLSSNRPFFGNYDIEYRGERFKNIIQEYDRTNGALELSFFALNWLLENKYET